MQLEDSSPNERTQNLKIVYNALAEDSLRRLSSETRMLKKSPKKLMLSRESIVCLNPNQLQAVAGGATLNCTASDATNCTACSCRNTCLC